MGEPEHETKQRLEHERWELLHHLERALETPMVVLGLVWLVLLVVELVWGLSRPLELLSLAIWAAFVLDFALRLVLAPRKLGFLRGNWLTLVSLLLPALRVFRAVRALRMLRAARAVRGARLLKVVGSLNRGMRALGKSMGRRGFGYVVALTAVVTVAGAAGMYAFENLPGGLQSYWDALWWTAMVMTTLGSQYWPETAEGRLLGFLLSLYALAVLGYVTAALASFFVGRDAESSEGEVAGVGEIRALRREIEALRRELQAGRGAERR